MRKDDVDALREQLAKKEAIIEQQKRWSKLKKEQSWEFNMSVLKNIYEDKKMAADTRIGELERTNDRGQHDSNILRHKKSYQLEGGVYHLFKLLDERLTHIERFGMMDYGEEKDIVEYKPHNTNSNTVVSGCGALSDEYLNKPRRIVNITRDGSIEWTSDGNAIPPPQYNK